MKRIPSSFALGLSLPFLTASALTTSALTTTAWAQTAVQVLAPSTVVAPGTSASNGVAAEVNGEKIMTADLNRMVDSIKASEPSFSTGTPAAQKALSDVRTQVLDSLITTRLLAQEAARRKIVVDPKAVDAAVANIKSGFKTDTEFRTALQNDGKSPDDLRHAISDELAIRELSKQLTADVTVSGDDIAQFYRANLAEFTVPEGIKAHHILLAINANAPAPEKERVRKRALDLIKQLNTGASFESVAKANSDDAGTKAQGGDLGTFARGSAMKEFDDAVFAAPVNKIVGPVETDLGYHIIRVDQKIPAKTIPLSDVQNDPQLKALLIKQKVQKRLDDSIAKLRTAARISKKA